ncbi:MAG: isoleucine--tRNA ligase [Candidatus Woesearchaeota archaeon]
MERYNFKQIESEILDYWKKNLIYKKAKKKNQGKQPFTYLDGPPYTSGKIHLGTAWGKSLRDCIMRFKRMAGFDVWDRAGFDMHGLPTENKVASRFNFERKEQIEEFGVEKFQKECEKFCIENMDVMINDFTNMGVWMDFENPYMPIKPEFIEGVWHITKKAYNNKRLYKGAKVMTWCPRCATSVSKHELEYKQVTDDSIFVKFKVKHNEYLIIWTTTPWTIPFNLAVMVNPDILYVRIQVEEEVWIVAKELVDSFMKTVDKDYKILEEFKGKTLEGKKYEHIFYNENNVYEELKEYKNAFTVILSENVDISAGTGLVHTAPGCGPEDYEVGKKYGLPAFNELDQYGTFSERMKKFAGLVAKRDDHIFIEYIDNMGALVAKTKISHDYPTCWRCHGPVVFRPTEQWFFKVEDLRERMIELNKQVNWIPKAAFNAFESWLENIKDNGVTRQRYWGTPVPIWQCDCGEEIVIGSVSELKEKAGAVPENLHKPWIDKVTIPCPSCKEDMHRIPDIFDVWIDAGCAGFLCYDYPRREDLFKRYYPADLILEGKDQIRGWFNLLMVISTLGFDSSAFKNVYMHGFINDYRGEKMSKSLGNITSPQEVIDEHGSDVLRYYLIGAAKAGHDMNYNPEDPKTKMKNVLILWNLHRYLFDALETTGYIPDKVKGEAIEEQYALSRLNSMIKDATEAFETYHIYKVPGIIEETFLDFSRNYVQFVRDRINEKDVVNMLATFMIEVIKVFAPVAPFMTEQIFLNLKEPLKLEKESIHLYDWPSYDKGLIDTGLEAEMEIASRVVQAALSSREKSQIGLRWPIKKLIIQTEEHLDRVIGIIKTQVNCKEIETVKEFEHITYSVKPDYKQIGQLAKQDTQAVVAALESGDVIKKALEEGGYTVSVGENTYTLTTDHLSVVSEIAEGWAGSEFSGGAVYFRTELDEELINEGYAREIIRRVQNARKNANLKKVDRIDLGLVGDELKPIISEWKDHIKEKVGANVLHDEKIPADHEETATIKGKELKIFIKS